MEKQINSKWGGMKCRSVFQKLSLCASVVVLSLAPFGTSCGGSSKASASASAPLPGLPALSVPGPSNSYLGTQSPGDIWQVSIDHTANSFSAADLTNSGTGTALGSIVDQLGFLGLAQTNVSPPFQSFGFALEIPGRAFLLRPGANIAALAALVPGSCLTINGNVTFQFVALPGKNWAVGTDSAYGTVQASASTSTWNFSNFTQSTLGNSSQTNTTLNAGTCSSGAAGGLVTIPPNPPATVSATLGVGPSGFFVADQFLSSASGTASGAAGVIQPSASLDTGNVVGGSYLGFVYEPAVIASSSCTADCLAPTQMAAFSGSVTTCQTLPSSSGMCGGAFFNDILGDLKQASTDTTIEFGNEDSSNFGLYKSAKITIPDPAGSPGPCTPAGVPGTDSQGNPTCTLPAMAVVGNPENKFAIFLIAQDTVNQSPMVIYLFQQ